MIFPKLCMVIEDVETIKKVGFIFQSNAYTDETADYWSLTHRVNLIPAGCHGNLLVKINNLTLNYF